MNASQLDEEEIFQVARRIAGPAARTAYLKEVCGDDALLRGRVERLLKVCEQEASFLAAPACAPTIEMPTPAERPDTSIGPYKLLEAIGEGGMGTVYMAEQSQPVRRRVALKVIKPGMDTRQVIARFEAERQALALMDHPNIARVLDAGATESGRPYFVMELVRGIPITDYCDREQLSIPDRLELFVLVCRSVQHAHQKGVIHRDLKPSNVLVTVIDGVAVPKVIDFGVAKATGQALTERTLFTGFHQFVGTPLYMSPEQADLAGVDVDTRSDIYTLGVLLYELLTGTTPFEQETFRKAAFDEVRRIVREEEPPRPSLRLSSLGEKLTGVSARRGADPRRLNRAVRGELDWIAMRALEKDRSRRYETANDLAADVMRHLTGQPVEACPPSAWYRFTKYARRNRVVLSTATLVCLTLVAGTGVSLWQAAAARKAQRRAEAAEARAASEAAVARAVSEFLQGDLLGQAVGGSPRLTVREALDRASTRIGDHFRSQPLVESAIRTTLGTSYNTLLQHGLAVPHLERAVALRTLHLGPDHPDTVKSKGALADAYMWTGRHPNAIALREHLLQARTAALGADHPETLECIGALAEAYEFAGQWGVSAQLLEGVLEREQAVCGPAHPLTLEAMHHLAMNYGEMGRLAESMALHERLLRLHEAANGPRHDATVWPLRTFAQVCQRAGELERAAQLLKQTFEIERRRGDTFEKRKGIANTRGWQALNLLLQERYAESEPLAREAQTAYGEQCPDDARYFYWMSVRGAALCGLGRYAEAEPLLLRAYERMRTQEAVMSASERRRLAEAGQRVVTFYRLTQQPEKALAWHKKLAATHGPD